MSRTVVLAVLALSGAATAQPTTATGSDAAATAKNEATVLIPPQGGTADVPVRFSTNVVLSFPSALAPQVFQSSGSWEVRAWAGASDVVVRPRTSDAQPTTIALATQDGTVKVNISLSVVPESAEGLTLVRFVAASAEAAFKSAVDAEVAKVRIAAAAELAALRRQHEADRRAMDATVRARADALVGKRILTRFESRGIKAHERNDDNVIVHGQRLVMIGADAYVIIEIENRSSSPYRLASATLLDDAGLNRATAVALVSSSTTEPEPGTVGVVPAGKSGHASLFVPNVDSIADKTLKLVIEEPRARRRVVVDRGFSLR